MKQSTFIKNYCDKSNITEDKLNKLGKVAIPCDCEEEDCNGWAMVSKENLQDHVDLYVNKK